MSARTWLTAALVAAVTAVTGVSAQAQSLAQRVNAVRDGTVHMSIATRPGVCGDGNGSTWTNYSGRVNPGWQRTCIPGPLHVQLARDGGTTVSIRSCIACRRSSETHGDVDLGQVQPADAARYLLSIARDAGARDADNAVSAAAMADAGDLSQDFMRLIRDDDATLSARKQALFWFGQQDGSTRELVSLYDSLEPLALREHYTFVLSQRHDDDVALTKLIDVARRDPDLKIRKQAMFWLGRSRDPKALQFFKDLLTR
jgi:hypothetical protein